MQVLSKLKRYAHTSCVKGVILERVHNQLNDVEKYKLKPEMKPAEGTTCLMIKTASYDQRFKTWLIQIKNKSEDQNGINLDPQIDEKQSQDQIVLINQSRNCLSDLNGICRCQIGHGEQYQR